MGYAPFCIRACKVTHFLSVAKENREKMNAREGKATRKRTSGRENPPVLSSRPSRVFIPPVTPFHPAPREYSSRPLRPFIPSVMSIHPAPPVLSFRPSRVLIPPVMSIDVFDTHKCFVPAECLVRREGGGCSGGGEGAVWH